ncbi:hypothetical protein ABCR94_24235 [Streptomyces sp. 21So2-11]|uniref:hypothetical protein n=1 Tax=Streptomyces sp. 21So2-11 TaxID=3144408 RepID=UPI00321A778B
MTETDTSRFVRLQVELVVEVTDPGALSTAALAAVAADAAGADGDRMHAQDSVREDVAEALAQLVDPLDLVGDVPGVVLAQASWSSEQIEYDPESLEWDLDEEEVGDRA